MLFQIAQYIRDRVQNIARHHGGSCAEIIGGIEASLGVDPGSRDGSIEGVESLGPQADNKSGEHITGASTREGR